jgi:hypothetical protein
MTMTITWLPSKTSHKSSAKRPYQLQVTIRPFAVAKQTLGNHQSQVSFAPMIYLALMIYLAP